MLTLFDLNDTTRLRQERTSSAPQKTCTRTFSPEQTRLRSKAASFASDEGLGNFGLKAFCMTVLLR
jgi:hypothetical protein